MNNLTPYLTVVVPDDKTDTSFLNPDDVINLKSYDLRSVRGKSRRSIIFFGVEREVVERDHPSLAVALECCMAVN